MKTIHVNASTSYDVLISNDLLADAGRHIAVATDAGPGRKICLVTDSNVAELYAGNDMPLMDSLSKEGFDVHCFVLPAGESAKTFDRLKGLLDFLAKERFTRDDIVVALGGGTVSDVAGFAASIYMRGIPHVIIPTTLLAMADASVGGKTGINSGYGKNLFGTFRQPALVLIDSTVLGTLPESNRSDGMAEIIKAGAIADASLLEACANGLPEDLTDCIARAVEIKKEITENDELESGCRRLLNFGHTIGHAIELTSDYAVSHGRAVAAGMIIMSAAADSRGLTKEPVTPLIRKALENAGFTFCSCVTVRHLFPGALADAALHDKKSHGDTLTIVLPEAPGKCILKDIDYSELESLIKEGLEAEV